MRTDPSLAPMRTTCRRSVSARNDKSRWIRFSSEPLLQPNRLRHRYPASGRGSTRAINVGRSRRLNLHLVSRSFQRSPSAAVGSQSPPHNPSHCPASPVQEAERRAPSPAAPAARGNNRVGRVASAAGARARSSDECDAGHLRGVATKLLPGAAATLWAAGIWPDSFVARRRRWTRIDSSSRLALGPNPCCAIPRDYFHGLLVKDPRS
jgi:hypothetical protein